MKEIPVESLDFRTTYFGKDWMALTAGTEAGFNTMTIAWGQIGSLWDCEGPSGKGTYPVATVYVRPQRYTKNFMDKERLFTLSWFGGAMRSALAYCGSHSGRDVDKVKATGLTPVFSAGTVYFKEAKLVFICRKLYQSRLLESGFTDAAVSERNYPDKDFHEMYIGEIIQVLAED